MKRLILFLMWIAAAVIPCSAYSPGETEAREWCDRNVLSAVEGIWEYPEDGARVLIQKDATRPGTFTLTILSTPDCRLNPGDIIGRLYPSIDTHRFRLEQMTDKNKLTLIKPYECTATLSADGESLRMNSPKLKLRIKINTLLPRFWRIVRLSVKNPADDLPAGLVKVYPGYDHNGSLRRKIRIL